MNGTDPTYGYNGGGPDDDAEGCLLALFLLAIGLLAVIGLCVAIFGW